ncbi:unnamed protein product, partial [Vitrella brassicaformis CCMP3155]
HDLTHPIDAPSQAATDIAKSLSFDKVNVVTVENAPGFDPPPSTPSTAPAIIEHLPQFQRATELRIHSAVGGPAGRLLAERMPREVETVWFGAAVSTETRRGVLGTLGEGREVGTAELGHDCSHISLTQGGAFDGWESESFPSIRTILIYFSVPDDLKDAVAANLIRDGLSTLLKAGVRGLASVALDLPDYKYGDRQDKHGDLDDAIRQVFRDRSRVGDFIINTWDGVGPRFWYESVTATRTS